MPGRAMRESRDVGAAGTIDAGGDHHLARHHDARTARRLQRHAQGLARVFDPLDAGVVLDGQREIVAKPEQIFHPLFLRDAHQLVPRPGALARFVPGAECGRGQTVVRPGQLLDGAQRPHPRPGDPGPLLAGIAAVDQQDVGDLLAQQPESRRDARLPGADDENVDHGGAVLGLVLQRPGARRVGKQLHLVAEPVFQSLQGAVHVDAVCLDGVFDQRRLRLGSKVSLSASPTRLMAMTVTKIAIPGKTER